LKSMDDRTCVIEIYSCQAKYSAKLWRPTPLSSLINVNKTSDELGENIKIVRQNNLSELLPVRTFLVLWLIKIEISVLEM